MSPQFWLKKISELNLSGSLNIMNVCGGHERTISSSAIRSLLPTNIKLIPGPGCPVCVCPEESIKFAIKLSEQENIIVASFGDMLRVPINVGKKEINSLSASRTQGNSVVAIASPMETLQLALDHPKKIIVFFVAGFETTLAPIVSLLEQGIPNNLKLIIAARKTWPVVDTLLQSNDNPLDALIAPGHVASIMGSTEWDFLDKKYNKACAIAGFDDESLLAAIYSVCRQHVEDNHFLDNCYPSVVSMDGNPVAKSLIQKFFHIYKANWRGIGEIENSGFQLRREYQVWDAEYYFSDLWKSILEHKNIQKKDMPPGCDCDQVVLGKIQPNQCRLFNKACTPSQPAGPCMVSDEGACHIWWKAGVHKIPIALPNEQ